MQTTEPEALALSLIFNEFGIKPGGIQMLEYADTVMRNLKKAGWGAENVNSQGPRSPREMELRTTEITAAFRRAGFKPDLLQQDGGAFDTFVQAVVDLGFAPPPIRQSSPQAHRP